MLEKTQRLIIEVLSGAMSMKSIRASITEFDLELQKVIEALK